MTHCPLITFTDIRRTNKIYSMVHTTHAPATFDSKEKKKYEKIVLLERI